MDFFPKIAATAPPPALPFPDDDAADVHDSITSLMNMADKMEALLPPECHIDLPLALPADKPAAADAAPIPAPVFEPRFQDCLSSVTAAPALCALPPPADRFKHELALLPAPAKPPPPAPFDARAAPRRPAPYAPPPADAAALYRAQTAPPLVLSACTSPGVRAACGANASSNTSPVAVRDLDVTALAEQLPARAAGVCKGRKTGRKPKTYSKPVASRFCHICSRMPRRGQGSATCRRMAEGFCRKIVCEQCLREQGWNYEHIAKNPRSWLCPHCADICPARSQCHIYNRINARRKRSGAKMATSGGGASSVAAALASSDVLLAPYVHLFQGGAAQQILQPPPNFRLTLGPEYCIDRDASSVVVHRKEL